MYNITFSGVSYSIWRADGTAIVYRDRCKRTALAVLRDLLRAA